MNTEEKLFIPLLLGTNRDGRASGAAARWLFAQMEARDEIETVFFDARDFQFPTDDYGQTIKDTFPEYKDAIIRADGLVIVSPEYNHGYPGILKSVLDVLLPEYKHKALGIAGVSAGPWGGARMIENLIQVARELGFVVSKSDLNFPNARDLFDENGAMGKENASAYEKRAQKFLDELVWLAHALRWGRENLSHEA